MKREPRPRGSTGAPSLCVPGAHVLPLGHPPARASSGSSSGAYRPGRTSCASLGRVPHEDEKEEEEEEDCQEKEEG